MTEMPQHPVAHTKETEAERIARWRGDFAIQWLGATELEAGWLVVVAEEGVDLHELEPLIASGCPLITAVDIIR